jgi:hypothetical protein
MIRNPFTTGIEKSSIRIASEFADSGHGTESDPWINGIQEAYDDAIDDGRTPVVSLGEGYYKATHAIKLDGLVDGQTYGTYKVFGSGGNRSIITTENDVTFNLFELNESQNGAMGWLSGFKTTYNGARIVIKNFNMGELHLFDCEFRADRAHDGLLVFNPTSLNLTYNQIEQCYFLGGTDPTVYQIQFKKPGNYNTSEVLMSECFLRSSFKVGITPGYGGVIDVEADALDKWAFTSCRWADVGDRPLMNIQGKIGPGGFGGIHPVILHDYNKTTALSRLIYFHDLVSAHKPRIKITGIEIDDNSRYPHYGVFIGNNWDHIQITGNSLLDFSTTAIYVDPGANAHGRIENNLGANPIGVKATPFDNTNDLVHMNGGAAGPTKASTTYTVAMTGCRIISTGGTAVSITIKDKAYAIISSPGATCDEWLEPEWRINFGAFSAAPTVKVAFR